MPAILSPSAKQQFFTDAGVLAAGYLLYTYAANTTTNQATFTDRAGAVPNDNPIVLDARGEAIIYLTPGIVYDYVLKTPGGSTVWTREDVTATAGDANAVSFQQRGTGAIQRSSQEKMRERYTALDIIPEALHEDIAAGTSITNVASYIAQACDNADEIVLPPGRYYVTDAFTVPTGKRLRGSGKHKTILYVPDTFNMSADGVIVLQDNTEPGAAVEDLSIVFEQPDTNVRADLNQYPPAIKVDAAPRFSVRRVRIELAWNGIDMKGNNGGAVIDDLEVSSFNIDIDIDGAMDSVRLSKTHHWPFGLASRPLLYELYKSNLHKGLRCGRCDDLHLVDGLFYDLPTATDFYTSASGTTFGCIIGTDFDIGGGLNVNGGHLITITGSFFSLGRTDAVLANISTGAVVAFSGCTLITAAQPSGNVSVPISGTNTVVMFTGCNFGSGPLDASSVSASSNATLNVTGCDFGRQAAVTYTRATIAYNTATGVVAGCSSRAKGGGTGNFVHVQTDHDVAVVNNKAPGWGLLFPTGALTNARVAPGPQVVACGSGTYTSNGVGVVAVPHGSPMRPKAVVPAVSGVGGAVHVQAGPIDDTNFQLYFTDMAGAALAGAAVTINWVAVG